MGLKLATHGLTIALWLTLNGWLTIDRRITLNGWIIRRITLNGWIIRRRSFWTAIIIAYGWRSWIVWGR
jgi:hypothetical protein